MLLVFHPRLLEFVLWCGKLLSLGVGMTAPTSLQINKLEIELMVCGTVSGAGYNLED